MARGLLWPGAMKRIQHVIMGLGLASLISACVAEGDELALTAAAVEIHAEQSIAVGYARGSVIVDGGAVLAWGHGPRGDGSASGPTEPVEVAGIDNAVAVGAGWGYSCALLDDGAVACWGKNMYGRLGTGSDADALVPQPVVGISNAVELSVARTHACARLADTRAVCWGEGYDGQLTKVAGGRSNVPVFITEPYVIPGTSFTVRLQVHDITSIAAGYGFTCYTRSDGRASCVGTNGRGQLGRGTVTSGANADPAPVVGVTNATAVTAGYRHACVVTADAGMRCWGDNYWGQLGNNSTSTAPVPTPQVVKRELAPWWPVPVTAYAITRADAGDAHTCALLSGQVWCVGFSNGGELGPGSVTGTTYRMLKPTGVSAIGVSAGAQTTCLRRPDFSFGCWGGSSLDYFPLGAATPAIVSVDAAPVADGVLQLTAVTSAGASITAVRSGEVELAYEIVERTDPEDGTLWVVVEVAVPAGAGELALELASDDTGERIEHTVTWGVTVDGRDESHR